MSVSNPLLPQMLPKSKPAAVSSVPVILKGLTLSAIVGLVVSVYMALVYTGTDAVQGEVQRIFYLHVPAFSGASVAFGAACVAGVLYLRTRSAKWDALAIAGVEVGLMLSMITIVTGAIWARPIWNTWWTWDPRLTSCAIMALVYAAYLLLRNGIESIDRRRTFAAVYGILAIATVIFTFMITRIRPDTIHPTVIGPSVNNTAQGGFAMADAMKTAISVNSMIACVLIAPALIWWRIRLQNMLEAVQRRRATLE